MDSPRHTVLAKTRASGKSYRPLAALAIAAALTISACAHSSGVSINPADGICYTVPSLGTICYQPFTGTATLTVAGQAQQQPLRVSRNGAGLLTLTDAQGRTITIREGRATLDAPPASGPPANFSAK